MPVLVELRSHLLVCGLFDELEDALSDGCIDVSLVETWLHEKFSKLGQLSHGVCLELLAKALDEVVEVRALRVDSIDDPHQVKEKILADLVLGNMLAMVVQVARDNQPT